MSLALVNTDRAAAAEAIDLWPGKIVVAHRGASGYLPEHTLESKAMAYAMDAQYLEQDVVMSKDDQLIVLHDLTLDRTTDVAEKFPGRAREDGKHYVVDFTLAELLTLNVTEGFNVRNNQVEQNYPGRFPMWKSSFKLHTLAQEIEMIQGMNFATGKNVGIYPEIKSPGFHRQEGKDLSQAVIAELKRYGYVSKTDKVYLQTFEFDELKRIHDELLPAAGIELKLVQLVESSDREMITPQGIAEIARYADGLGPEKGSIIDSESTPGNLRISHVVSEAHRHGMQVHPYTFRLDEGHIPQYASSFEHMLELFFTDAGVDGIFTDFPDRAVNYLKGR
jgi:glycerophosphoryl diester phosphodiesterase